MKIDKFPVTAHSREGFFPLYHCNTSQYFVVFSPFCSSDMTVWGLDLGLQTMRRGEFSRFLLKPSYAYGEMGCPPLIPPGATVLYEVQVIDYLDSAQVDEFFALLPVSFENIASTFLHL